MKNIFLKDVIKHLSVSVAVLVAIAGVVLLREKTQKEKPEFGICLFSPTPAPTSTPLDQKIKDFGLEIKKIDILVPIIKNVDGSDKASYNKSLQSGVAHYDGTALPGEKGNIFIFGHSSADVKGDYSKVFASLNDLQKDDEITVFYQNNEHKYKVTGKRIVEATDLSVLDKGKKEVLTLMTCWPIGTKEKRLIVKAEPV